MKRTSFIVPVLLLVQVWASCKKEDTAPEPPGEDSTVIEPPVDPAVAPTIGFFMDDWQQRTFSAPAWTSQPVPATADVTLSIDRSAVLSKIPLSLFGNNANLYMTQMVTEPMLLQHIAKLQPHLIRYPGGNISSIFFWNAPPNTPPADAPATMADADGNEQTAYYWYGQNTDNWTLAVDNYYSMLQQTGNSGMITVNYGYARYGTSSDPVAAAAHLAANWVRYDKGRTKYWEIGNESGGTWQAGYRINTGNNKDNQPEIITGALYGAHCKVFADSMKKAAAETGHTIYIGIQLLQEEPASWATATDKTWNAGVLAEAAGIADFYIVHNYYTPYNTNSSPADILASAKTVTGNMMSYLKQNIPANGAAIKPIALTEWNIFAVGSMQAVSHVAGMHAVLVLGELLKNGYGMAARWDLSNGWDNGNDHGLFNAGDEPGGVDKWNPRPAFYYMYFFRQYGGDRLVQSSLSGSTAGLQAYGTSYSSGEAGAIVVNTSATARTVELQVKNFQAGSRFYWYTLQGGASGNGFSRKVLVNGTGPDGVSGGPDNYATLKAFAAATSEGIRVSIPAGAVIYLVIDKK